MAHFEVDPIKRLIRNGNLEAQYGPKDFVNPDSFDPRPQMDKAFVVLNGGFVEAIVFAEHYSYSEQDALDEAADSGKLGSPLTDEELEEYIVADGNEEPNEYDGRVVHLGNAGEPYDQEGWEMWVLPASLFAEELCLMTFDRVMERLKEFEEDAERVYKPLPATDPRWSAAYKACADAEDAITLARLIGGTRSEFEVL